MDTFRRIRNVDTFGHTVMSNRTRLGELDTFEGKDTFLSVSYILPGMDFRIFEIAKRLDSSLFCCKVKLYHYN